MPRTGLRTLLTIGLRLAFVAIPSNGEADQTGVEDAELFPSLVSHDGDGRAVTVRYSALTPLLLNELQKQQGSSRCRQPSLPSCGHA